MNKLGYIGNYPRDRFEIIDMIPAGILELTRL